MADRTRVPTTDVSALRANWNRWAHNMDPDMSDYPMSFMQFKALADEVEHLRSEVERLRKWDQQLRQWLVDREVEVGNIDLSGPPPAEEALTLDEIRERLGIPATDQEASDGR